MSHRGAAFLLELDGFDSQVLELTMPRRLRTRSVIVHVARPIPMRDLVRVDGIPVTNGARTVVDLAAVVDAETLEVALDAALRRRRDLTTPA